jgi:hypothetical protein
MPHYGLECFRVWRDVGRVDGRNDDADVSNFGRVAAVSADDAQDFRPHSFCVLQSSHQIGADISCAIAATDRKDEHEIVRAQAADAQPGLEHGCPAFVVGSRRQFRDVVRWRVGFDPCYFAEIVHRVRSVGGAAAHTKDEQASAGIASRGQQRGSLFDAGGVKAVNYFLGFR